MRVFRTNKGGSATMIIECDQTVPEEAIKALKEIKNVESVRFINKVL